MKIAKTISTVGVGAAIVSGSMLAVTLASAQTNDKQSEVVDRLATELNVDKAKVQGVFDTLKEEHKAEHKAAEAERLSSLVADGTLTQEQVDALTTKQDELDSARYALKEQNLSRNEIHTKMAELKTEFESWATEQGIDLSAIRPDDSHGKGRHRGGTGMDKDGSNIENDNTDSGT